MSENTFYMFTPCFKHRKVGEAFCNTRCIAFMHMKRKCTCSLFSCWKITKEQVKFLGIGKLIYDHRKCDNRKQIIVRMIIEN